MDGADVRVIQGRSSPRFPSEALQRLWIVSEVFGKELQGDMPTQLEVFSLIDNTHPAAADLAE